MAATLSQQPRRSRQWPAQPDPSNPSTRPISPLKRHAILAEMAARLLAGEDPDRDVMPALYRALAAQCAVDATLGFVVCDLEEGLRLGFMEGFDQEMVRKCLTLDFGQAVCGTVAATGQPMHVTDVQRSLDPLSDLVRSAGITAYACEPLIVDERIIGTLSFGSRTRRRFEADEILFFREIKGSRGRPAACLEPELALPGLKRARHSGRQNDALCPRSLFIVSASP